MPSTDQVASTGSTGAPAAVRAGCYVAVPWAALLMLPVSEALAVGLLVVLSVVAAVLLVRDRAADPAVLLVVLAFTICDASPLAVEGSVVRLYQLSALLVLVVAARRRRELWSAVTRLAGLAKGIVVLLLVITALTVLSLVWTISLTQTSVSSVGQASAAALLVVTAAAVAAAVVEVRQVLTALWVMATAGSAVAVAQFVVTVLTPWELAQSGGSGIPWPRPTGLMTESVWAALVAATGLGLAFVVRRAWPQAAWASVALHVATLVLVMSRAVLLGMVVGGAVVLVVAGRRHLTARRVVAIGVLAAVALGVASVVAPALVQRFDPRLVLGATGGTDGGSAASRAAVYRLVADELPHHLPFGAGAGALNELTTDPAMRDRYVEGGELNSGRGSTNLFLGFTFDFGPVGTALIVAFVVLVFVLGVRLSARDGGLTLYLASLYLVDFQFNNGLRFGFVHVLLGVAVAALGLDRSAPEAPSARGVLGALPESPVSPPRTPGTVGRR